MFPDFSSYLKPYFSLSEGFPPGYKGPLLPDAAVLTAMGKPGTIVLQEISAGELNIELSSYYFIRKIKIPFLSDTILLNAALALQNKFLFRGKGIENILINQGQYVFLHTAGKPFDAIFEKEKDYQLFNIRYTEKTISDIRPSFPELLHSFFVKLKEGKPFAFTKPARAPKEVKKITQEILGFPYHGKPREYMFDKKVKESLCMLLIKQDINLKKGTDPRMGEAEKLNSIATLLINHLNRRYSVTELARQSQINVTKLQSLFRKIYGNTVYRFQRDAKLQMAHKLLEEEQRSVKYASLAAGYKSISSFDSEFKTYFGYTPGSLLKKKK
jgi:AraC-like DNA-binding protein